jgi:hypothetical protein
MWFCSSFFFLQVRNLSGFTNSVHSVVGNSELIDDLFLLTSRFLNLFFLFLPYSFSVVFGRKSFSKVDLLEDWKR